MIRLENLCKVFNSGRSNQSQVLTDINLQITQATASLLEGTSGSGKTTLLSILAGLTKPTSGNYFFEDQNLSHWSERFLTLFRQQNVGILFQNFQLLPAKSVLENIALPLYCLPLSPTAIRQAAQRAAQEAHIEHKLSSPVRLLSGGEQQRTALARAIVNRPKIIFADEPTSQLDRSNAQRLIELFAQLKAQGTTLVITTHDPFLQNSSLIDCRFRMQEGRIEQI
jgi:putative ABC transport system ATP-binding protein